MLQSDKQLRAFVASLPREELHLIHLNHEDWERRGSTGNTTLRRRTQEFMDRFDIDQSKTAIYMHSLATEVWRRLAVEVIREEEGRHYEFRWGWRWC